MQQQCHKNKNRGSARLRRVPASAVDDKWREWAPMFAIGLDESLVALNHVLIKMTRRRGQRLVLKAAEPEGLEAYRLLLQRCAPISTVMTVPTKLVDLLATTFSGDLMDSSTDLNDEQHPGSMTRKEHHQV